MPGQHSSNRPQGPDYGNSQNYQHSRASDPAESENQRFRLSRRNLLIGAASAGAVGVVAAAGATVATRSHDVAAATQDLAAVATSKGPIIIFMNDPDSGEMDIFAGTGQTHHKNTSMAAMVKSMAPQS